jgi:hypothetical protein
MGAAHETCADESDTEFAHSRGPFWILFSGGAIYGINIPYLQMMELKFFRVKKRKQP